LGAFPGGNDSEGFAINFWGEVAGYSDFGGSSSHAALWSRGTGLRDLGSIPPESDFSFGQAINLYRDIAGYSTYGVLGNEHAVRWIGGVLQDLGALPGGTLAEALGINDLGEITGFSNSGHSEPHAFLWSAARGMQDLGTLPGGYYSQGLAINLQGEITGYSNDGHGNWWAILWKRSTGMQVLPGASGTGTAINNLGHVAGGTGPGVFAALWTSVQHVESLGTLPGAGWSSAFALNDLDQVVGWSGYHAFVWTRGEGMQDLNNLIPPDSGWTLAAAEGINLKGQITGYGTINGQTHAFLLTPLSR
jgi:probable HAF family extracellular repeat protein